MPDYKVGERGGGAGRLTGDQTPLKGTEGN